jgi:hypothetical protein
MDKHRFDHISATLATSQTRRHTLRLVGASILGIGGVSILGLEGDARRKRKKGGKKGGKGGEGGFLPSGALCQSDSQCNAKQNQICEVPQNASNSDHRCCGAQGAVCGGVNEDGDFIGPLCCIGEAGVRSFVCSQSDPNNPFVPGTCIPAPQD